LWAYLALPEVRISCVIITLNEERNLARCIGSLQGVADDVVVVDSFSSDGTERIAKEHGARFVQHKFEGHIEQKNWAITQAQHSWVLSLDADEALSEELRNSITAAKQRDDADGYTMNRLTNYCGRWIRHGGWYPDRKLRLWDRRKGRWTGVNPHDRFELERRQQDQASGRRPPALQLLHGRGTPTAGGAFLDHRG
jgi:glycosyltransferase involved in cell wall biosynthesis